jgi:OOP family OmpA-OmpF porin
MKKIGMLITVIMLIAISTIAQAEVKAGSFTITPFAGVYTFEGNEGGNDWSLNKQALSVGLRAGYNFTEHIGVEGVFNYVPAEVKDMPGDNGVNLYEYGVEGLYHFMPESRFVPFLAVGMGEAHYDTPAGADNMNKFYIDAGAGVKFFITENVALRADARWVLPTNDNYNDFMGTLGITFAFGGHKKEVAVARVEEPLPPPPPPPPPPSPAPKCTNVPKGCIVDKYGCPFDSDGDGVCDGLDKCPNTPKGCIVDKYGCPMDSDGDGVCDGLDKCPDTPKGCIVDKDGCPIDSDGDGVCDGLDKCPNTPPGAKVESDGCIHEKVTIRLNVEFDTDKSDIKDKYNDEINKVADFMKEHPETTCEIQGHTDNVDRFNNPDHNKQLSQARADSVRQYLIDKLGIESTRLTAVGYGPDRPIASNDTKEGRQKNRRVEGLIDAIVIK